LSDGMDWPEATTVMKSDWSAGYPRRIKFSQFFRGANSYESPSRLRSPTCDGGKCG
jgi:hypothetical protein